jgi:phage-related minor tail protein
MIRNPLATLAPYAIAILLVLLGIQTLRLSAEAQAHAETRAERDRINAAAARAALDASETLRRFEQIQAAKAEEQRHAYETEKASLRRTADRLRRDLDGVRDTLRTYASGGSGTPEAPTPSGDDRARALGDVLGEGVRLVGELAEAAERHSSEARALWAERQGLSCSP